ncbi:hypothetical protein SEA_CECE_284 [Microbacterium phage Cece]|nr:hypothetical protein SEA_CECE_284 [Microbacterium phage Cece]
MEEPEVTDIGEEGLKAFAVVGITPESVQGYKENKAAKGRRDQRICVCGHGGRAHFALDGQGGDIDTLGEGEVGCQAGKVPCACNHFKWVVTLPDIRSFIQKTEGPGEAHALQKGLVSSLARGVAPTWREGLRCFWCKREPSECGTLIPIAYNERGGEALRSTPRNMLMCAECRVAVATQVSGGA